MSYAIGDAKRFLKNKANFTMFLIICVFILQIIMIFLSHNYAIKIMKKINHRYFNLTNSIKEVYNIDINTLDGSVKLKNRHKVNNLYLLENDF